MLKDKKVMGKRIMVIGSTCVDIIINIDHLPETEEDIHPSSQSMALGGCAFNVASILKLFGAAVTLVSPVGSGFYGEYVDKELKKRGFDAKIYVPDQENGCCYCLVEAGGERTFMSYHGAEYTFRREWMREYDGVPSDMVYFCGLEIEEPTGEELLDYLEGLEGCEFFYAPGPRGIRISLEKMERIYALHPVLHINEAEARALSGCQSVEEAGEALFERTQNAVVITLSRRGAYCREQGGKNCMVEGFPVEVADTIGAGDSHIGALMACLSMGMPYAEGLRIANQTASLVVGVKGASLPEEEFKKMGAFAGHI